MPAMKCIQIVIITAVLALALVCPNDSIAATKPVSGKNTAPAVRSNAVGKPAQKTTPSNRRTPNRGTEQYIVKHMKEIRLPEVSFKPPATIVDAVEFFRTASRNYDRADIPIEERGFNFVLKISDDGAGVPSVPPLFLGDIAFDEALKLVCESVGYMFSVEGGIIVVRSTALGEMELRGYSLKPAFAKVLDSLCASERNGNPVETVFSNLGGVDWPQGASIFYVKAAGKLRVRNTHENLTKLERVLTAFKATSSPLTPPNTRSPDPAAERAIVKRMKEMRLPSVSFKPPATIVDAVEFFHVASRECGRADIPIEKCGFNFALKPLEGNVVWPIIPAISASDIRFDEALKLVCESVCFKFKVRGNIVFIGFADADEIELRTYSLRSSFVKSLTKTDSKRGSGRRGADDEESLDWNEFLSNLGVTWPEDSMILYIKQSSTLFVRNTPENLSTLENALKELKAIQSH